MATVLPQLHTLDRSYTPYKRRSAGRSSAATNRSSSPAANSIGNAKLTTPEGFRDVPAPTGIDERGDTTVAAAAAAAAMKRLPIGKCQPYVALFEDALDQLAVLGDITHDVGVRNEINKPASEEITRIIRDQKSLENKYQRLIQEQNLLKALPNKTKYRESQIEILDITNELQQKTHVLARNLKSHPSVAQNLLKIQTERSSLQALISKSIRELKDLSFESLSTTVEEEYRKKNTLQNTIQQERAAVETLKGLQRELANEKIMLEEDKNDRILVIQQLKDTIQEINALTTSEQKYIKKETKAHEASVKQQCQRKESFLLEEKNTLLRQTEQDQKAHARIVQFLTHQREELDRDIQDWIVRYEEDTESKAKELENLKQRRTQDMDRFDELVVKYEELEHIVEEDRENRRKLAEEQLALAVKQRACKKIQRWWRRLRTARALESKNKKPSKAGKKKGAAGAKKGAKGTKAKKAK